jgi:hypothetical protein
LTLASLAVVDAAVAELAVKRSSCGCDASPYGAGWDAGAVGDVVDREWGEACLAMEELVFACSCVFCEFAGVLEAGLLVLGEVEAPARGERPGVGDGAASSHLWAQCNGNSQIPD